MRLPSRSNDVSPLRIATVSYLNAKPLMRGFQTRALEGDYAVTESSPALCARELASGRVDVALIPSIEYQRIQGLRVLPGMAIAARRRARSVLLISKVAAPEIRRLALDASSRTSAVLARIWLDRRARNRVEYLEAPPRLGAMLERSDAALLIGDAALQAETAGLRVYDLAAEWYEMTGLPFVFAFWAVRPGVRLPEGIEPFSASLALGLSSLPAIIEEEAARLELPRDVLESYFRQNIHYDLGVEEARSFWLFSRLAREAGAVEAVRELAYHEPAAGNLRQAGESG
jgi:chorismate dehydratase